MSSSQIFLTAEWRNLILLNYEVSPALLRSLVPLGTELDSWNGKTFMSLVGFQFLKTKVMGLPIPFHANFEEVNLRFYVRRQTGGEVHRGVVFIREVVPRRAIAYVARALYNEKYIALPMDHKIEARNREGVAATYRWRLNGLWNQVLFESQGRPELPRDHSQEQFITDHYWGYAAQRDGGCVEYQVTHPSWKVWQARSAAFSGDVSELYGSEFVAVLRGRPASPFLADGSAVSVMRGRRL